MSYGFHTNFALTDRFGFKPGGDGEFPLTWASIYGSNVYEWWDYNNDSTVSETGGLIDSITSLGSNGGLLESSGVNRPSRITDTILGGKTSDFDGLSEYMEVAGSTGMYNFLHDGSGGAVIVVFNDNSAPTTSLAMIMANSLGTLDIGIRLQRRQAQNDIACRVPNGGGSAYAVLNNETTPTAYNQYNSLVSTFDTGNAIAADRNNLIINGTSNKNNSQTTPASTSNATENLRIGARAGAANTDNFKGQIREILIINTLPTPSQLILTQTKLAQYGSFPIL